jgi:hypothetical protein
MAETRASTSAAARLCPEASFITATWFWPDVNQFEIVAPSLVPMMDTLRSFPMCWNDDAAQAKENEESARAYLAAIANESQSEDGYSKRSANSTDSSGGVFGQIMCNMALGTSMLNIFSPCN